MCYGRKISAENERRCERARRALDRAAPGGCLDLDDLEDAIVDLVTDLLHVAAAQSAIEPDEVLRLASIHFAAEIEE